MADTSILDVSEILDSFDTEEIQKLIYAQIPLQPEEDIYSGSNADYLTPLYTQYRKYFEDEIPDDAQVEIITRFTEICKMYIERICKKFDMEMDQDWLIENIGKLPNITIALYSFFVLDFKNNLEEVFLKYIYTNKAKIREAFSNLEGKKDSQYQVNKKIMGDEDMVVIASHIFDVTKWILSQMDEEEFFGHLDDGYVAGGIVNQLLDRLILHGQPIEAIQTLYELNIPLRSAVGFDLICKLRKEFSVSK